MRAPNRTMASLSAGKNPGPVSMRPQTYLGTDSAQPLATAWAHAVPRASWLPKRATMSGSPEWIRSASQPWKSPPERAVAGRYSAAPAL